MAGGSNLLLLFRRRDEYVPEVQDYRTRVAANGGSLSVTTLQAYDTLTRTLKADPNGTWNQVYAGGLGRLNMIAGDQLAAALVPFLQGAGSATDTNNNFVSGDYTEATGLAGNGSTKYLSTGLPASTFSPADMSMTAAHANMSGSLGTLLGAGGVGGNEVVQLEMSAGSLVGRISPAIAVFSQLAITANSPGVYGVSSISLTSLTSRRNTTSGTTVTTNRAGTLTTNPITAFARNANGSPSVYLAAQMRGYVICYGLTLTQWGVLRDALEAFNDSLGRGVI